MVTEATFDTGEVKLHYAERIDDVPSGAPLVLLHGISASWLTWALVLCSRELDESACPSSKAKTT